MDLFRGGNPINSTSKHLHYTPEMYHSFIQTELLGITKGIYPVSISSLIFYKYRKLDCLLLQIVNFKESHIGPVPFWRVQFFMTEVTQNEYILSQLQQIG